MTRKQVVVGVLTLFLVFIGLWMFKKGIRDPLAWRAVGLGGVLGILPFSTGRCLSVVVVFAHTAKSIFEEVGYEVTFV